QGGFGASSSISTASSQPGSSGTSVGGAGPSSGPGPASGTSFSASSGTGGACMTNADCADADSCTTDLCSSGLCNHIPRDDDADGFVSAACGGNDCNDLDPQVNPGAPELCSDGVDNDCNGVADCFDPACAGVPNCGCKPQAENCKNGKDDDCDGK